MTGKVVILGASGRFGRHALQAFAEAGWQVKSFDRHTEDLNEAARGVDVIINGWNPPYDQWAKSIPEMTQNVIAAAKASGATVLIPGNVYVYGQDASERFAEDTPHGARNPLGQVRIQMEAAYRAADVPTIVLRAGDFLDTAASGNWFDRIITAKIERGSLSYPGRTDVPHAWAYLPDMAAAAVALCAQRETLDTYEEVCFPGFTLSGQDLANVCAEVVGRPLTCKQMNWLPLKLARPFWPMARGIVEMRYLWNKPHHLDGGKFDRLLPDFQHTDPVVAMRSALRHKIDPDKPVPGGATFVTDE